MAFNPKEEIVRAINNSDLHAMQEIFQHLAPDFINIVYMENPEEGAYTLLDLAIMKSDNPDLTEGQRDAADLIVEFMHSHGAMSSKFLMPDYNSIGDMSAELASAAANVNARAAAEAAAYGAASASAPRYAPAIGSPRQTPEEFADVLAATIRRARKADIASAKRQAEMANPQAQKPPSRIEKIGIAGAFARRGTRGGKYKKPRRPRTRSGRKTRRRT